MDYQSEAFSSKTRYSSRIYRVWSKVMTQFGNIMLATDPPKVRAVHIREALKQLKVGDVICRKFHCYLDSYFIKGEYTHSGIVISSTEMVHAIAEGVSSIDPIDFIKDTDGFVILRPRYPDPVAGPLDTCSYARNQIGKGYDFLFERDGTEYFYCHKLTYYSLIAGNAAGTMSCAFAKDVIYADYLIRLCDLVYEPIP